MIKRRPAKVLPYTSKAAQRYGSIRAALGTQGQTIERHTALKPRVFGSVAHGTDGKDTDLDILIDSTAETTLFDIGAMCTELKCLLGIEVDVLSHQLR